jgi:hypothetical protein
MVAWLANYGPEIDNVRTALDWCFGAGGNRPMGVELAGVSTILWYLSSRIGEGCIQIDRALAHIGPDTPKAVEACLWYSHGFLTTGRPKGRALPALERAVALYREIADPLPLGRALDVYGLSLTRAGRLEDGDAALSEAAALLAGRSEQKSYVRCLTNLAVARIAMGRFEEARSLIAEAMARGRAAEADYWVLRTRSTGRR